MTIVAATDLSSTSQPAVTAALALARRFKEPLVLAHAYAPLSLRIPEVPWDAATEEPVRRAAERALQAQAEDGLRAGVSVQARTLDGVAGPTALAELAREVNASLLVVGTHGRSAFGRAALGSFAEAAILHSRVPVLVVRTTEAATRLTRALGEDRPLRITAGVDTTTASGAAVAWIRALGARVPCHTTYVHLYWPPVECARLGLPHPPLEFDAPDPAVAQALAQELAPVLGDEATRSVLRVLPNLGAPGEHLAQEARSADADLLVIGTHQRRAFERAFLGSTVHAALRASPVAVLCVPALGA